MLTIGVLCGLALDAGYFYIDIALGAFLEVFGMMSELCHPFITSEMLTQQRVLAG
jgi:hypothetical protein